jgi:hypothetical protein
MTNVNRVKRSLFRAGEMQDCLTPTCSQGFEVPAVEVVGPQDGTQDGFDASSTEQAQGGVNGVGKSRPIELNPLGQQPSQANFQQNGPQAVDSASSRTQPVGQSQSSSQASFRDEQDFSARAVQDAALNAQGARPYEFTGFNFQDQGDVPEFEPVQQAAQSSAAAPQPQFIPEVVEPFQLRQHQEVRA